MSLDNLSTEDLRHLAANDYSKLSTEALRTLAGVSNTSAKHKTMWVEDIAEGMDSLKSTAKTAGQMFYGAGLTYTGNQDKADEVYKDMETRQAAEDVHKATLDQGTSGEFISGVSQVVPMIAAAPFIGPAAAATVMSGMSALDRGSRNIQKGASNSQAITQAIGEGTLDYLGNMLPVGRGIVKGAGLGAAGNLISDAGSDVLAKFTLGNTEAVQNYDPSLKKYLMSGAIGAVPGAAFGRMNRNGALEAPKKPKVEDTKVDVDPMALPVEQMKLTVDTLNKHLSSLEYKIEKYKELDVRNLGEEEHKNYLDTIDDYNKTKSDINTIERGLLLEEERVKKLTPTEETPVVKQDPILETPTYEQPPTVKGILDNIDLSLGRNDVDPIIERGTNPQAFETGFQKTTHSINGERYEAKGDQGYLEVKKYNADGELVATGTFIEKNKYDDPSERTMVASNVKTEEGHRRKGHMSDLYDYAQTIGGKLAPQIAGASGEGMLFRRAYDVSRKQNTSTTTLLENVHKGDVRGALSVLTKSNDTVVSKLARALLDNPLIGKLTKISFDAGLPHSAHMERTTGNVVFKNEGKVTPQALLHEVVHTATSKVIDLYYSGKNKFGNERVLKAAKNICDLHDTLVNLYRESLGSRIGEDKAADVLANPKELVAYGITDPMVINALKHITIGEKTAFASLMNSIKKMFGFGKDASNAYDVLLDNTKTLIKESDGSGAYAKQGVDKISSNIKDIGFKASTANGVVAEIGNILKKIPLQVTKHGLTASIPQIYKEHPLIQEIGSILHNAEKNMQSHMINLLGGRRALDQFKSEGKYWLKLAHSVMKNNILYIARKATPADGAAVLDVFQKGSTDPALYYSQEQLKTGQDYVDILNKHGKHLNEKQVDLYNALAKHYMKVWDIASKSQIALGLKPVNRLMGYHHANRVGRYGLVMHYKDIPIHFEWFLSEPDRLAAKQRIDKYAKEVTSVEVSRDDMKNDNSDYLAEALGDIAASHDPEKQLLNKLTELTTKAGEIGGHQKHRSGISGYAGTELFQDANKRGSRFIESIESWTSEYMDQIRRREIINKSDKYLSGETGSELRKQCPNAAMLADHIIAQQTGGVTSFGKNIIGEAIKNAFADVRRMFLNRDGSNKEVVRFFDNISGITGTIFNVFTMTGRPAMWLAQGMTTFMATRSLFNTNANPFSAMDSVMKGIIQASGGKHFLSEDMIAGLHFIAENTHTFHPQLSNELNNIKFGSDPDAKINKVASILTGQAMSASADSISRYVSWLIFYNNGFKEGKRGKELWKEAARLTDDNMFVYGRRHQASMYTKLGIVGELASPLKIFAHNQLGNLVADTRQFVINPEFRTMMPVVMTFMNMAITGGVASLPLLVEYELLRHIGIKTGMWGNEWPSVIQHLLTMSPYVSHGVLSGATGVDVGASVRYNSLLNVPLDNPKGLVGMFPTISFLTEIAPALAHAALSSTGLGNYTENERREFTKKITPKGIAWGAIDALKFGSMDREYVPYGAEGDALVPQTGTEIASSFIGSRSLPEARAQSYAYESKLTEDARNKRKSRAIQFITEGKPEIGMKMLDGLDVKGDQIKSGVETLIDNRNRPLLERMVSNKKGQVKSYDQRRKFQSMADFLEAENEYKE